MSTELSGKAAQLRADEMYRAALASGTASAGPALHVCAKCGEWRTTYWFPSGGGSGACTPRYCRECTPEERR
jgi:hypothetical protein